jgi:putative transposase
VRNQKISMPQSLVKNYIHIVFSTKHRFPFIDESIEDELFKYLGGICRERECYPLRIGGYKDHVHILCILSRKIALMKLIEELKSHSSKWIKDKNKNFHNFYWQRGYGGFSVNPMQTGVVENYILNQKYHHKIKTYQEEYLTFLIKYNIEYDGRYIWD